MVLHHWKEVRDYILKLRLNDLTSNALIAEAAEIAKIGYFNCQFKLDRFDGSMSGTFEDPVDPELLQGTFKINANPTDGGFEVRSSDRTQSVKK